MTEKAKKVRVDRLLVERGLAPTREKAQALVMAGCVFAGQTKAAKSGQLFAADTPLEVRGEDHPYVGRGGVKLAGALDRFAVDPRDRICMDVGASTGGFTDCLLRRGARRVYAVDVGYGQLAWAIATDPRVVVIERTNIRTLAPERIPDAVALAVIDVSFISLAIVLPAVAPFLARGADVVALIKPQFEAGREALGKGGIVSDPLEHERVCAGITAFLRAQGWRVLGVTASPVEGGDGNREFLVAAGKFH